MRTFLDGDQWCCVDDNFQDLQTSPAGFGLTGVEAFVEYCKVTDQTLYAAFDGDNLISFSSKIEGLASEDSEGLNIAWHEIEKPNNHAIAEEQK